MVLPFLIIFRYICLVYYLFTCNIELMYYSRFTTVDGRYPVNNGIFTTSTGAGVLPSTVLQYYVYFLFVLLLVETARATRKFCQTLTNVPCRWLFGEVMLSDRGSSQAW